MVAATITEVAVALRTLLAAPRLRLAVVATIRLLLEAPRRPHPGTIKMAVVETPPCHPLTNIMVSVNIEAEVGIITTTGLKAVALAAPVAAEASWQAAGTVAELRILPAVVVHAASVAVLEVVLKAVKAASNNTEIIKIVVIIMMVVSTLEKTLRKNVRSVYKMNASQVIAPKIVAIVMVPDSTTIITTTIIIAVDGVTAIVALVVAATLAARKLVPAAVTPLVNVGGEAAGLLNAACKKVFR